MGTEILRPHDVLAERFRFPQTTRKNHTNLFLDKKTHSTSKKTSSPRPTDKKKHITLPRRKDDVIINNNNNQVKKVTILRRGESLDCLSSVKLPKEKKGDTYAGSAFSMSPSPRSLPLPSFFNNKQLNEDPATRDLRRLLRLE